MTQFKVGDRVRLTGVEWGGGLAGTPQIGDVVTITSIDEDGDAGFGDGWYILTDGYEGELAEEQPNRTYYEGAVNLVELMSDPGPATKSYGGSTLRHPSDTPIDPHHYKFPGGAEVIHISQWLTANAAQALQYIARSSRIDGKNKGDASEDIRKAITFLEFELKRLEGK